MMTLPGKLTIGLLQEDNPQKFYFRTRPLFVEEERGFEAVEGAREQFGEDGYIRIVPDKNEISHFKARMRSLGRYCLVDLRKHPNENDKIRPNKNFSAENGDRNAYIVYSDVILKAPAIQFAEICPIEPDVDPAGLAIATPGTYYIMLSRGGKLEGPYEWETVDELSARLKVPEGTEQFLLDEAIANVREAETDTGRVRYLMNLALYGVREPREPEAAKRPIAPAATARAEKGTEASEKVEAAAVEAPAVSAEAPAETPEAEPVEAAPIAEAAETVSEPVEAPEPPKQPDVPSQPEPPKQPDAPKQPEPAAPESAPTAKSESKKTDRPKRPADTAKPWLQHTTFTPNRSVNARMNPREQSLVLQSGINPKRGRSLQDVVDEQWRQSRYEQLGHPVPADANAQPVTSPIERAAEAFRDAWSLPEARSVLVRELLRQDELAKALGMKREADRADEDARTMTRLEADRLKMLDEIDALKKQRQEQKTQLLEELRRTNATEIREAEKRIASLRSAQDEAERAAKEAQAAAEATDAAAKERIRGAVDALLAEDAVKARARAVLKYGQELPAAAATVPEVSAPSANELVNSLRVRFENEGYALTNDEAVSLLAAFALGRWIVFSAPVGCGKSDWARMLARALGLRERFCEVQAQCDWASPAGFASGARLTRLRALTGIADQLAPVALFLDDANRAPIECYAGELLTLGEAGEHALSASGEDLPLRDALRVIASVQDDGHPLTAKLLDRAHFIRLRPLAADAPAPAARRETVEPERAVSLEALSRAFSPTAESPDEVMTLLDDLRAKLAEYGVTLSRRALIDMRDYASAVSPLMQCGAQGVLDFAFSQRALPAILASASVEALHALPKLLEGMPRSLYLMTQPLPVPQF